MATVLLRFTKAAAIAAALLHIPAHAADRQKIAALNVASTSLVTWAGCFVHAKLTKTPPRHARCLAAGAVGGAGYYQAKRLAGDGHITTAWLLANLTSSVVENTTAGEHPLARVGYSFGPLRLRLATPFDRARESLLDVDVNAAEVGYLARAVIDADDVDIRDGMIWYETENPQVDEQGRALHGYTYGVYPGVWMHARSDVRSHETVHAVQALQLDAVEPPALVLDRERRRVRVRHLRLGLLNLADNAGSQLLPYEDRWFEIEAYRFAGDREPPR